jgi:hypothetical protein
VIIQLNQFFRLKDCRYHKKGKVFLLFLFLFTISYGSSIDYFSNDFRDKNNTIYLTNQTDIKSNKLNIKVFDNKWINLPSHIKSNSIFGYMNFEAYYTFNNIKLGIMQRKSIDLKVNEGFMQTWDNIDDGFTGLLNQNSIGNSIDNINIKGSVDYIYTKGIFLQKVMNYHNHSVSTRFNYFNGKDMQYLNINGDNNKHFKMSLDYYYTKKNRISKNTDHQDNFNGVGYGMDIEYIYRKNKLYFYGGIFNIGSFIKWKNITYMHYDFNSQMIYMGEDGYNHYRPFASGYYKYNIDFKQKIPMYYKTTIDYKLDDIYNIGLNTDFYSNNSYNELYFTTLLLSSKIKVGYIYENRNIICGINYYNFQFELSNKFGSNHQTVFKGAYKIAFLTL